MNKQLEIQKYLSTVPCATIDEIYANVSFSYYNNYKKYLGEILSRMAKNGKIERVKKGIFKYVDAKTFMNNCEQSVCQFCGKPKYVKKDIESGMYLCLTCKRCRQTVL